MTPALRIVVVEDEAVSRANIERYLLETPDVLILGAASNGPEAVSMIDALRPDLVLLDVQLPELDGISVLRRIRHRPEIVFTTAHDVYAVTAFELGALDYLVKPFGAQRLREAVERVRVRRPDGASTVYRALHATATPLARLFARKAGRIVPIAVRDIRRIQASGEYAEVHTADGTFLLQLTLRELMAALDPLVFEQIHRSHIVNLDAVAHLQAEDDRRLCVTLNDGTRIVASRAASERLRSWVR